MFELDVRLEQDTVAIGQFSLSTVLLSKDANYPWCILVPQRENVREIHHLSNDDRLQLLKESCGLAELMESLFKPFKMNVAALGNMVPQLHLHHIARYENDVVWPGPVWGKVEAKAYEADLLEQRVGALREGLLRVRSDLAFEASTKSE